MVEKKEPLTGKTKKQDKKGKKPARKKVSTLEAEIEELQEANRELQDKYLRLAAEFDNFKKRTIREKLNLINTAAEETMSVLLPILDDFDRAKKSADDENTDEYFSDGVLLVYNKIHNVLASRGLQGMETDGEIFDPELHEAITKLPAPNDDQKGTICDTVEKGYTLNEKIIRHAKVVVFQ